MSTTDEKVETRGRKALDLRGYRFGQLVVVDRAGTAGGSDKSALWSCRCACGNMVTLSAALLKRHPERVCGPDCGCFVSSETFAKKNLLLKTILPHGGETRPRDAANGPENLLDPRHPLAGRPFVSRRDGGVYFIQGVDGGPIKIGFTTNHVRHRLSSLQAGSPVVLRVLLAILGTTILERELHFHFRRSRLHNEWFAPTNDLLDHIETLRSGLVVAA